MFFDPAALVPTFDAFDETISAYEDSTKPLLVPIYAEFLADMETVVSLFRRIEHRPNAFLLESVSGGENIARYSFFGSDPRLVFASRGTDYTLDDGDSLLVETLPEGRDPMHIVEALMNECEYVGREDLPRFVGGAVGVIGYDWVRFLEPVGNRAPDVLEVDDVRLLFTDVLCIFDHVRHTLRIVANARVEQNSDIAAVYAYISDTIRDYSEHLRKPAPPDDYPLPVLNSEPFASNMTRETYDRIIETAREYIAAGDIIQVVLSQRFTKPLQAAPFSVYRALRSINPSPYMFYIAYDTGLTIAGASPEILVTDDNGHVTVRPIAGTRRRGKNADEDKALEAELLADAKEVAEHVMLVDLGRNDLGRVCEYGTVQVDSLMHVEKYSHVMHIVSNVVGRRRADSSVYDVLRATFPAGTLSGAPKVRAMQIIEELEPSRRGIYGGAIGYFSYNGTFDACITIRTLVCIGDVCHVQAGGGIVWDSNSADEYAETINKSNAVRRALEMAERGLR